MSWVQSAILRELQAKEQLRVHRDWEDSVLDLVERGTIKIVRKTRKHFIVEKNEVTTNR